MSRYQKSVHCCWVCLCWAAVAAPAMADTSVGGPILTDTTWTVANSPYVISTASGGSIIVGGGATLTIEPGVEIRVEPMLAVLIGSTSWGEGAIVARGTAESPITFTSTQPLPQPGDWGRIEFLHYAIDASFDDDDNYDGGCILEHVIIEYAGYNDYAAVNVLQSAPFINYCDIRLNLDRGISVQGAPPLRIEYCHVHGNHNGGVYLYSHGITLRCNSINENTASSSGGGVHLTASNGNTLSGNTISDNTANYAGGGVYLHGSDDNLFSENTITGNTTNDGGGMTFNSHSCSNTLSGNTISSNFATEGGGGLSFRGYCDNNTLAGNTIAHNTTTRGGGLFSNYCNNNTLTHNTIHNNTVSMEGGGLCVCNSNYVSLSGNSIQFNHTTDGFTGGIYVTHTSQWLSLDGGEDSPNVISHNDGYQVYNNNEYYASDQRNDIHAGHVYWGTINTAAIQAGIYDFSDDAALATVHWTPHLQNPVPGDVDGDEDVDLADLATLLNTYGTCNGDSGFDAYADLDGDSCVELSDLAALLANYGYGG